MTDNSRATYVYFAESAKGIKVGCSRDPRSRVKTLRSQLLGFVPGTFTQERQIHRLLAEHRVVGEWFRPDAEVTAFVEECLTQGIPSDDEFLRRAFDRAALIWIVDSYAAAGSL